MGRFGGPVETISATRTGRFSFVPARGSVSTACHASISVDGAYRRVGVKPAALEQRERSRALEPCDGRKVGVRAPLAHRDEQGAVLGDSLPVRRVLGDDRAGRGRLGVRAVDDLHLRHGELVVSGALCDLGTGCPDSLADDVGRADTGRVAARDRVDAAPGDGQRDDEPGECGRESPARARVMRVDLPHDRRRLAKDPCDERGRGQRPCRIITCFLAPVGEPWQRGRVGSEVGGRGDGVAPAGRLAVEQPVDEANRLPRRARRRARQRRRRLVGATQAGREPVLAFEGHPPREHPEEDAAERVEVGRGARRAARRLLGRPVFGRPGKHA